MSTLRNTVRRDQLIEISINRRDAMLAVSDKIPWFLVLSF